MQNDKQLEITNGLIALEKSISSKRDVFEAFHRVDIGNISLIYGNEGDKNKNFKGGYGISHIIAKRNDEFEKGLTNENGVEVCKKIIETIVLGSIRKTVEAKQTIHIELNDYEAVLSLNWQGNKVTWIITGYKIL